MELLAQDQSFGRDATATEDRAHAPPCARSSVRAIRSVGVLLRGREAYPNANRGVDLTQGWVGCWGVGSGYPNSGRSILDCIEAEFCE